MYICINKHIKEMNVLFNMLVFACLKDIVHFISQFLQFSKQIIKTVILKHKY